MATRIACNTLLRYKNCLVVEAFLNNCINKHSRQQHTLRVGEQCTQGYRTGRWVYTDITELQRSLQGVLSRIFQD